MRAKHGHSKVSQCVEIMLYVVVHQDKMRNAINRLLVKKVQKLMTIFKGAAKMQFEIRFDVILYIYDVIYLYLCTQLCNT